MTEGTHKRRPPPPDYKRAAGKKTKGGGLWILLGMILSMGGSGGYYLFQQYRNRIAPNIPLEPSAIQSSAPQAPPVIPPEKARKNALAPPPGDSINTSAPAVIKNLTPAPTSFDFYKLLPEMQVGIPPEAVPNAPGKPPPKQLSKDVLAPKVGKITEPSPSSGIYVLQAGAFHTPQEADKLRARLAFLGVESRIQIVEKWHRVRLGPFRDLQQATQTQQRLQKNGFTTILSKESHD